MTPGRRQAGFTLLELLVGIVLLGLILAGVAQGVQFGQRAAATQDRLIAAHGDADAADRVLRRLIAAMQPGPRNGPPRLEGNAATLAFTADLRQAASGIGVAEADIGLGVDGDHRLVMRYAATVNATRLGPAPPPGVGVLLDGVDRVEFAYWGPGEGGAAQWLSSWTQATLPLMVRIRVHFAPSAARSWPDILVATQRVRPQS